MTGPAPELPEPVTAPDRSADRSGASRPASDDDAIPSEVLLDGRTEIRIRHRGEIYRLSLTRAGKLILHK
jgi:hemin uptake protein HemP